MNNTKKWRVFFLVTCQLCFQGVTSCVCLIHWKKSINVVIISLWPSYTCLPVRNGEWYPFCVWGFSHSSYIGKWSGIVGGPGEGGASGVWCCGDCVVHLSSTMLLVSSPFLRSAKSQMWNSNSGKSNTHSLLQSPVDSMWSLCNATSEPVTLSIKYVFVLKSPLKILDLNDKIPHYHQEFCLSNACLLTILLILEFFPVW